MDYRPMLDELLDLLSTANRINRSLALREGKGRLSTLSAIQIQAMITIRRHGVLNMSELADHLLVTRPQLTKMIDSLVELEFIVRKPNPKSRREVLIELSDRGKAYIEEQLLGRDSFLARVFATASEEEIEALHQATGTMRRIFSRMDID